MAEESTTIPYPHRMSAEMYLSKCFARALVDPSITLVIGQCRVDQGERLRRRNIAALPWVELGLRPVFVAESLKGRRNLPDLIFVDNGPISRMWGTSRDPRQLADFTPDDGMLVLGLLPLTKFQEALRRPSKDQRWKAVTEAQVQALAPLELFRKLKAEKVLNEQTVFSVAPAGLARPIDLPPLKLPPLNDLKPEESGRQSTWRHALTTLPPRPKLPTAFKDDLRLIVNEVSLGEAESLEHGRQLYLKFHSSGLRRRLEQNIKSEMGKMVVQALEQEVSSQP